MYKDTTEVLELGSVNMNNNSKKKLIFRVMPLIMVPALSVLTIITLHSKRLIIIPINSVKKSKLSSQRNLI